MGDGLTPGPVAVIGQGSIGRRHASILLELGETVVAYDPAPGVSPDGVRRVDSVPAALEGARAAVIASPSSQHLAHARAALDAGVPVLVEKPLAMFPGEAAELEALAVERRSLLAVAMNLRHHAGVIGLSQLLREGRLGRVLTARVWSGSWLPGWRPETDYRQGYSARAELGGGVLHDVAVHELDYLLWLLGRAAAVTAVTRRVSALEIDVEDVAMITLELESGTLADATVDYFDRAYHRGCRLVGEHATAHWDWEQESLTVTAADGSVDRSAVSADVAGTYRQQLREFLSAVAGKPARVVTATEARHVLQVIEGARASSQAGRRIVLAPEIVLRRAQMTDAELIRRWRNDPETRRHSRTEAEVTTAEHERWLRATLSSAADDLWIAEAGGSAVGQIRAGRGPDGWAELHVNVAPEGRGRGVGTALIEQAGARALARPGIVGLLAHVKPDNPASLRAFERAGFAAAGRDDTGLTRLERRRG